MSAPILRCGHWEQCKKSPNFLFTFAHRDAQECAKHFCKQPHRRILVDSGAYTEWSKGKPVDDEYLDKYINFCRKILDIQKFSKCSVSFVALDVSLGKKGDKIEKLTSAVIEQACEKGWANYKKMQDKRIPCLPVFHELENTKWLTRIADACDYFAISPRKDQRPAIRHRWLKMVFRYIGRSKRIHGLGVSSEDWLMEFPFFSADNTDWQWPGKTKRYPMARRNWSLRDWENRARKDRIPVREVEKILGRVMHEPDPNGQSGWQWLATLAMARELEKQHRVTEFWQKKGVVWDEEMPKRMIIAE